MVSGAKDFLFRRACVAEKRSTKVSPRFWATEAIALEYRARLAFSCLPSGKSRLADRFSKAMGDTSTNRGAAAPL